MDVFVVILVWVDDEWQSTCGGVLGVIFCAKLKICYCCCQTQLLGLKVFSIVFVRGLVATSPLALR